jgi:hypothetical protein
MQRTQHAHRELDPLSQLMQLPKIIVQAQDNLKVTSTPSSICTVQFDEHVTQCSQCRRATTIFPVKSARLWRLLQEQNKHDELVPKLCSAETSHENEQEKLENLVQEVAELDEPPHVNGYVSETVLFHKLEETLTSAANNSIPHCNIAFRKLVPITTLSDKEFLRAWWDVVICKLFPQRFLMSTDYDNRSSYSLDIWCPSPRHQS